MKHNIKKYQSKAVKLAKTYAMIALGTAITAFAITAFIVPNKIAAGGISGLSSIIYNVTQILPVGTLVLIFNIPLFILSMIFCGKSFGVNTIISTLMLSGFLTLYEKIPSIQNGLVHDVVLATLFGGAIMGLGMGIVFAAGTSTGGTDIIAKLLQLIMRHVSMGTFILLLDAAIITTAIIVFRDIEIGLYSALTLFIQTRVIDTILEGISFAKMIFIVSSKPQEIADVIMKIPRGVTGLKGVGMFTGEDKTILMCTVKRQQIPKIKDIIKSIDENAFLIIGDVREVMGEGFTREVSTHSKDTISPTE